MIGYTLQGGKIATIIYNGPHKIGDLFVCLPENLFLSIGQQGTPIKGNDPCV
jgi:hypothetical protein